MDFREWIGRTETVSDVVTPTPYAALSATFDRPAERPAPGTPLPALWHWLYFLPLHRRYRWRIRNELGTLFQAPYRSTKILKDCR